MAKDITSHWSRLAECKYISYKKVMAYSVGGISVNTVSAVFQKYLPLNAGCFLFGDTGQAHLPLFFYDMTEARQKQYIEELKQCAAREEELCPTA